MTDTRAIVIAVDGHEALVESMQGGGCGNCDSANGCGSGKLSQLFGSKPRRFRVLNDGNAQVGTIVQVSVPEGVLLRSALLMYLLPLLLMLGGAMLAAQMASDASSTDIYAALGGGFGLLSGFWLAKGVSVRHRWSSVAQAVILPSSEAGSARQ